MRLGIIWPWCGVALVAVVAAGCSSAQDGSPTAVPGTTNSEPSSPGSKSTSPSVDETYGAPRVEHPLDASRFHAQPCAVLSQAQLAKFGLSKPGVPETTGAVAENAGPFCTWTTDGQPFHGYGVGYLTGNKNGLSDTYRGQDRFKYFEATTVNGYPAVFNDLTDGRAQGQCNITVGISDTQTFRASETAPSVGKESCDGAKQVAAEVIASLKGGG